MPSTQAYQQFDQVHEFVQTVHSPAAARRGSVLHYTVVLTGRPPDGSFTVDEPCPLYQQGFSSDAAAGGSYLLRCNPLERVPAGQAVAYDLQLAVPADAPLGPTTLTWQFLEPALPALNAHVTIVR